MDIDKIKEAQQLLEECKELKQQYLNCHDDLTKNYSIYKNEYNNDIISKSDNAISDLKILLNYLKTNDELKMVYHSYKCLLKVMLNYKKKIIYYAKLSTPNISNTELIRLVNEQNQIMDVVQKISNALPDLKNI
jgi:hypothetical protein